MALFSDAVCRYFRVTRLDCFKDDCLFFIIRQNLKVILVDVAGNLNYMFKIVSDLCFDAQPAGLIDDRPEI